jgi:cephalosporin-C deacetylase
MAARGRPEHFVSSVTKPDDFDDFWEQVQAELDALPLDPEMRHIPERSTPDVDVYEIHYTSLGGVRIAGWYCRPKADYLEAPYPGLAIVPGYVSEPTLPKSWAKLGYAAVGVAPRGKLRSNAQYNPGYPGLLVDRIIDKNTYAYRAFYADALRAIDFMLTRPEIDASRIGVHGGSQGGALSLVCCALRRDVVTCSALSAPYLTGFMDSAALTHSYPYEEMNEYFHTYPDRVDQVRETVSYFDCLNFAPMITAPLLLYVGLADDICPPETAFALREALTCDVTFHTYEGAGHEAGVYWELAKVEAFLAEHLRPDTPFRVVTDIPEEY